MLLVVNACTKCITNLIIGVFTLFLIRQNYNHEKNKQDIKWL
jgi:hypothetical protein